VNWKAKIFSLINGIKEKARSDAGFFIAGARIFFIGRSGGRRLHIALQSPRSVESA